MELIKSLAALENNIATLESYRNNTLNTGEYLKLIKRGRCFFPYILKGKVHFAPSRFIGYTKNSLSKHSNNDDKHGTKTNKAINNIVGSLPLPNVNIEGLYILFCKRIKS